MDFVIRRLRAILGRCYVQRRSLALVFDRVNGETGASIAIDGADGHWLGGATL